MERKMMRIVQLMAVLTVAVFAAPFFKFAAMHSNVIGVATEAPADYDTFSGFAFALESLKPFFTSGFSLSGFGISMSILLLVLCIILLLQTLFAIIEKPRIVSDLAMPLFAAPFIFWLFIFKNDDVTIIQWGYYVFILFEALLIVLAPMAKLKKN